MSNKEIKDLASRLTDEQQWEYHSPPYRRAMAYWIRRIRRELAHS